jgi:hypothetical protein
MRPPQPVPGYERGAAGGRPGPCARADGAASPREPEESLFACGSPGAWASASNHFDRVGHYMQGVTPALVMREVLLRKTKIGRNAWLTFSSVSVALAFSALYEILEWLWVAAFYPDQGPEWLGMQGDMFDAQADMLMAFLGGLTSAVVLARVHDASLRDLEGRVPQTHER